MRSLVLSAQRLTEPGPSGEPPTPRAAATAARIAAAVGLSTPAASARSGAAPASTGVLMGTPCTPSTSSCGPQASVGSSLRQSTLLPLPPLATPLATPHAYAGDGAGRAGRAEDQEGAEEAGGGGAGEAVLLLSPLSVAMGGPEVEPPGTAMVADMVELLRRIRDG